MSARITAGAANLAYALRWRIRTIHVELRYCRALRLALLAKAQGGGWWRAAGALRATHDVTTVRLDGYWFLVGPQDPRSLERLPDPVRWAWYVCGPSLSATVNPSLSWEESVPGFSPRMVLDYCREWADVAASAERGPTT